jgi:hypothetical protein
MNGLHLCFCFQKPGALYHFYFTFYNFVKYQNLKFSKYIITLLACNVKKNIKI